MTDKLYRLVYYSRNEVIGSAEVLDAVVASILATSRINNAQAGITGALMFNSGCFGQVLEGARVAVEEVFERIQQDERHGDISLLAFDQVLDRTFATWSMGYVGTSQRKMDRFDLLGLNSRLDLTGMSGDVLFETLQRLAIEQEHAIA